MGGNRPMTVRRAASLGAVVAVLLGVATGLSHVGHSTVSKCNGTWRVIVDHADDRASTSTQNTRASSYAPAPCQSSAAGAHGGWDAFALFDTQTEAEAYAQQLVAAGYVQKVGFQPVVEQATPTP